MKSNTQNAKIEAITKKTLVLGIDVGSEMHYARAFDYRGIEYSKKPFKFSNTEAGFVTFKEWILDLKERHEKDKEPVPKSMQVDSYGYPVYFMISEGQRNDINYAIPLLDHIGIDGSKVLADRGYDSNQLIDYIYDHGGEPTIPSRRGDKFERRCDWWFYKERHLVENYFLKLKAFRRIATRCDKLTFTYLGFLCIVSILIWLK